MNQFIDLLGKIGIDPPLLLAQILNFLILLWILKKFLYGPLIKRIESDEIELQKARTQREQLEKEQADFLIQKREEINKTQALSKKRIVEAEKVAEEIKKRTKEEVSQEMSNFLLLMKKLMKTKKTSIQKTELTNLQNNLTARFIEEAKRMSRSSHKLSQELENYFLTDLKNKINTLPPQAFQSAAPSLVLETASTLNKTKLTGIEKSIAKKFKQQISLVHKTTPDLISGYRLEVGGYMIEHNFLNEIKSLTKNGKTV